ncbi:heat repeat-containing protein 1 [Stylonychia lemnae]|uniref:HEAT repeat-containing protein 1 n=1 Tax=Stylonychia lemnae TaxID=5949 RepID=A0A078AM16_STYLE|nr:heat repeat-containing protein 1 [Stylonychia lemnae]|eukprot:CDW83415.1 heat repeat-containing protein 1 [Stylonychia lemnae]
MTQQTSLAQQLNQLKIAQKDEVKLPSRTKLSFLFDIKQAANVDDQTLYYIALTGVRDLIKDFPQLQVHLVDYQSDILNEKSLQFYRGTQTQDALKEVEERLESLIKLFAPFLLHNATHRVIEYLVRIYEINAFHKETLLLSFLPYFETAFFIKLIQIINLKHDDFYQFLDQYAFKGQAIDKATLIKSLSRNDSLLFSKYSQFCFDLSEFLQQFNIMSEGFLHWKFYGAMIVEILKSQNGQTQTSLFNLLPFISKGMKSEIKDFKVSSLMAISQLACRKSLSAQYAQAFFKQVLQSIKDYSLRMEEDLVERGVLVLGLICQYQQIQVLEEKDVQTLLQITKITSILQKVNHQYDLSFLLRTITVTSLTKQGIDIKQVYQKVIQNLLNLKLAYILIESALVLCMQSEAHNDNCQDLLKLIKAQNQSDYNNVILFILKQSKDSKDKILGILQGHSADNLFSKFGEKEYSLLSALASQSKITKLNALKSIQENHKKLTSNERGLIKLSLVQMIQAAQEEELIISQVIQILAKLINDEQQESNDYDFEYLSQFHEQNLSTKRYSDSINGSVLELLVGLTVQTKDNQMQKQILLLSLKNVKTANVPVLFSIISKKHEISQNELIQELNTNQNSHDVLIILLRNFKQYTQSTDIAQIIKHQFESRSQQDKLSLAQDILKAIKSSIKVIPKELQIQILDQVLELLSKGINSMDNKLISLLIGYGLKLKHQSNSFDMNKLLGDIIKLFFQNDLKQYVSFLISFGVESKNAQKRKFAIMNLKEISKLSIITPAFMVMSTLIYLNDESSLVRMEAINLAKQLIVQSENLNQIEIFNNTQKPKSAKKQNDRQDFTPLKSKPLKSILKDLVAMGNEIITDKSQLQIVLSNSPHTKVIDQVVRHILDLPTITLKSKFVEILSLLTNFSLVFSMSLQEQLNKEFFQLKQGKTAEQELAYLYQIGSLIQQICKKQGSDMVEEHISSLLFPYLKIVFTLPLNYQHEDLVLNLLTKVVIRDNQINLKPANVSELLKYYLKSQVLIVSKLIRQQIKEAYINIKEETFSDKEILPILGEIKLNLQNKKKDHSQDLSQYEVLLELLGQIRVENDYQILQPLFHIVQFLSQAKQVDNQFYLIEVSNQVALQIVENKKNSKKNLGQNFDLILNVLNQSYENLKSEVNNRLENHRQSAFDPFKEFMMEIENKTENQNDENDGDSNQEFIGRFQIISSILNLVSQYELITSNNQVVTNKFMDRLSNMIIELTQNEKSHSSTGSNLVLQLFRFYLNQIVRILKQQGKRNQDQKQILSQFIDTLLMLQDFVTDIKMHYGFLEKVLIALEGKYTTFIVFVLLIHAKDQISVKENLQVDSLETNLIEKVIGDYLSPLKSLQLLEELLFFVTSLRLSETSNEFIKSRLLLVFNQDIVNKRMDDVFWCEQKYLIDNDKEARRLKYLTVYMLNNMISNSTQFQKQLAIITHTESKELKSSYQLFYQIYLSSAVFNKSVNNLLQNKEYIIDKKSKKSLKRLFGRVQDFQKNLNNLLSYEIQIDIVKKVLDFEDKQTLYLKTQSVQLLLNKTPQFSQGLSKIQEKELVSQFETLVQMSLKILQSQQEQGGAKQNNEKQSFTQALFSLIERTYSNLQSVETKRNILDLTIKYLKNAENYGFFLHSQLILNLVNIFEVQQLEILEHLPQYIDQIIAAFKRLDQSEESRDFFTDSFTKTVLKASLSVCVYFSKFMTPLQYQQILENVIVIPDNYENEVKQILEIIAQVSTQAAGLKVIFQALINCYDSVIIEEGIENKKYKNLSQIIIRFFDQLMKRVIQRMKKDFCQENYKKINLFFRSAFSITNNFHKNNQDDMKDFKEIELSVSRSFEQFVIKLNEDQLRLIIVKLTKWGFKSTKEDTSFHYNIHKTTQFFRAINTVLNGLKEFFVPLLPLYLEKLIDVLTVFGQSKISQGKKRTQSQFSFEYENIDSTHTMYDLMILACENIRLNFLYDNMAFIQNDTFEKLSEPLSNLSTLEVLGNQYLNFIEDSLKPTVLEIIERINNDDMWKKINNELFMHTRHTNPMIRLGTFRIIENLYMKLGERFLILLNDTIQFLSEGMEDENPDVEATARSIVQRIEQITGDSIHEYLK